jgi:hypothetical protein
LQHNETRRIFNAPRFCVASARHAQSNIRFNRRAIEMCGGIREVDVMIKRRPR